MVSERCEGQRGAYQAARRTVFADGPEDVDARRVQHVEKAVKRLCVKPYSIHNLHFGTGCLGDEKDRELRSGI